MCAENMLFLRYKQNEAAALKCTYRNQHQIVCIGIRVLSLTKFWPTKFWLCSRLSPVSDACSFDLVVLIDVWLVIYAWFNPEFVQILAEQRGVRLAVSSSWYIQFHLQRSSTQTINHVIFVPRIFCCIYLLLWWHYMRVSWINLCWTAIIHSFLMRPQTIFMSALFQVPSFIVT
jgi:hypothetical protein